MYRIEYLAASYQGIPMDTVKLIGDDLEVVGLVTITCSSCCIMSISEASRHATRENKRVTVSHSEITDAIYGLAVLGGRTAWAQGALKQFNQAWP